MPHAVSRLRAAHLARFHTPYRAPGGFKSERCERCRLLPSHCMCALTPRVATRSGVCLLMTEIEPLKPSNTGWLIADLVADTFAFGWSRTSPNPGLLALLQDPQWLPVVVFPGEYAPPERVITELPLEAMAALPGNRRPLFIIFDATWSEARKMFRKSPYLDALPVLSLRLEQVSQYRLRRSRRDDHFCTSEVAALCLSMASEAQAGQLLEAYLEVFSHHYLQARNQQPVDWGSAAHARLRELAAIA